jgi:hypothetical protein
MAGFKNLTFAVNPVTLNGTSLNSAIVAGTSRVAGILDPVSGINRMYDPASVGFTPSGSDATSVWLPVVSTITATTVNDQYWAAVPGSTQGANNKMGQVQVTLTAGSSDTVRASSVMAFKLSPQALVLTATGTL